MFLTGIVRMEPLDNLDYTNENSRETGFIDRFDQEVIPLQANSYLGWFGLNFSLSILFFFGYTLFHEFKQQNLFTFQDSLWTLECL